MSVMTVGHGLALSPSRAGDFRSCPLKFRFRAVDRLPEAPSPVAARGTLVHSVLERLFDAPAGDRTLTAAHGLVPGELETLLAESPELAELMTDLEAEEPGWRASWLAGVESLLAAYFDMEDPSRLEPAEREQRVEVTLASGLCLRGFVDRLDVAPGGEMRVVDYKTGRSPSDLYAGQAMFQLRFYALILWRSRGVLPLQLRLMYLSDKDMLTYTPDEADLLRFERTVEALAVAIGRALERQDFRPRTSRLCDYCDFRDLCPAWGGTPPPYPESGTESSPADQEVGQ